MVLQKIISGNEFKNGRIVTGVDQIGNSDTVEAKVDHNVFVAQSGNLADRFDDVTYYTA